MTTTYDKKSIADYTLNFATPKTEQKFSLDVFKRLFGGVTSDGIGEPNFKKAIEYLVKAIPQSETPIEEEEGEEDNTDLNPGAVAAAIAASQQKPTDTSAAVAAAIAASQPKTMDQETIASYQQKPVDSEAKTTDTSAAVAAAVAAASQKDDSAAVAAAVAAASQKDDSAAITAAVAEASQKDDSAAITAAVAAASQKDDSAAVAAAVAAASQKDDSAAITAAVAEASQKDDSAAITAAVAAASQKDDSATPIITNSDSESDLDSESKSDSESDSGSKPDTKTAPTMVLSSDSITYVTPQGIVYISKRDNTNTPPKIYEYEQTIDNMDIKREVKLDKDHDNKSIIVINNGETTVSKENFAELYPKTVKNYGLETVKNYDDKKLEDLFNKTTKSSIASIKAILGK